MNRRDWLKRTSLALAGGLVLGDEVMEQYERLTHKRIWALGGGLEHETVVVDGREIRVFKSRKVYGGFSVVPRSRLSPPNIVYLTHANVWPT